MLRTVPLLELSRDAALVKMVVCISLEEILPRPKAGLLSRMLRLADVSLVANPTSLEPVYLLHPGGEYHIGVSLFHPPSGQRVPVKGAAWVRVAVADGQTVSMDVERDQGMCTCLSLDHWHSTGKPYKHAHNRPLWREKTCLIMSWRAF